MGCVFLLHLDTANAPKGVDVLSGRIALKTVLLEAADATGMALFKRELAIWSGFRHTNIISLLEILDGGIAGPVAAMNWCVGSLRDFLNMQGKLSIKNSSTIICSLIDGLAYAYDCDKVLHLALKPENVLYRFDMKRFLDVANDTNDGLKGYYFMLSDWGIASIKQPRLNAIAGLAPTDRDAERTFNNMGTLCYMAPERFKRGTPSTAASDVFSLGMIYLEMIVGCLPFSREQHPVQSLLSGQYLDDSLALMRAAQNPNSIEKLILKMIAFLPSDRPTHYPSLRSAIVGGWRTLTGIFARLFIN